MDCVGDSLREPVEEVTNIVLTAYFTSSPDPNHLRGGITWSDDHAEMRARLGGLKESVERFGREYKCVTDVDIDGPEFIHVDRQPGSNPYWRRWREFSSYLNTRPDIEYAVGIDGTDTEMVTDPFPHLEPGKLYVGSETWTFGDPIARNDQAWLRVVGPMFINWYERNLSKTILNAGLMFADVVTFQAFVRDWLMLEDLGATNEMPTFNYLLYNPEWADKVVTGYPVHTRFDSWENTPGAWWRHK